MVEIISILIVKLLFRVIHTIIIMCLEKLLKMAYLMTYMGRKNLKISLIKDKGS